MAERQVVVFKLGDRDEYCIDISKVREIVRVQDITSLPGAGKYMEGIVNLRGQIVPVINIQRKFASPVAEREEKDAAGNELNDVQRRMIVVTMEEKHIGILVSAVSEILRVDEDNIEDAPAIVKSSSANDFISGVAKVGERLIVILNLEKIFSPGEMKAFSGAESESADGGAKIPAPGRKTGRKKGLEG